MRGCLFRQPLFVYERRGVKTQRLVCCSLAKVPPSSFLSKQAWPAKVLLVQKYIYQKDKNVIDLLNKTKTNMKRFYLLLITLIAGTSFLYAQQLPRDQWGAPMVTVTHTDGKWIIAGKKNKVTINESDLAMRIDAGTTAWNLAPSQDNDILAKSRGEEFYLGITDAGKIDIKHYDTGYKTGVKILLSQFKSKGLLTKGLDLDMSLCLTVCLEGATEELVCDAVAIEHETLVRQLYWPKEVDTKDVDYTALSNVRGTLLPSNWPKEYHPYRNVPAGQGQEALMKNDKSYIQSNLIECWSMSWWGFQKGKSALVVIVETPDDAGYKFNHPAGGPTVICPRWLSSLGKLSYPRSVRMSFIQGNYVDMCKRYRKHVMDIGHFVSLKDKIAREPMVEKLIGTPQLRQHTLRNYKPNSFRYDTVNKANNYRLVTFDERAKQLRAIKARGVDRVFITLAGWPYLGYDRQHPDALPPAPDAGGWEGLKRWVKTCDELGFMYNLHDQYRDYYVDAPSYDPQFAVHEEDNISQAKAFPGTRFGGTKEGYIPFMDYWDGGKMAYLNVRFALGHIKKNYQLLSDRGIKMQGSYQDVFGYVPPTEDFNPEHPLTRTEAIKCEAECFRWVRNNLGLVGTEASADWVIPYVDYSTDANAGGVIPVPLYQLVYHDAILTPEGGIRNPLRCLLNGGYPEIPRDTTKTEDWQMMRTISALHKRIALLEMINHEFLDKNYRKERTTFADGTTVTVDHDAKTFEIKPELK